MSVGAPGGADRCNWISKPSLCERSLLRCIVGLWQIFVAEVGCREPLWGGQHDPGRCRSAVGQCRCASANPLQQGNSNGVTSPYRSRQRPGDSDPGYSAIDNAPARRTLGSMVSERINHTNRIALVDPVIKAFGQQCRLARDRPLQRSASSIPPQNHQENPSRHRVRHWNLFVPTGILDSKSQYLPRLEANHPRCDR